MAKKEQEKQEVEEDRMKEVEKEKTEEEQTKETEKEQMHEEELERTDIVPPIDEVVEKRAKQVKESVSVTEKIIDVAHSVMKDAAEISKLTSGRQSISKPSAQDEEKIEVEYAPKEVSSKSTSAIAVHPITSMPSARGRHN